MDRISIIEEEQQIREALEDLACQERPNIAQTARVYMISEKKLRNRVKGVPSRLNNSNASKWLTNEQEYALQAILNRLDASGFPPRIRMLTSIANSLLRRAHQGEDPPPTVSHMWAPRWLAKHPEWNVGKGKPLATDRKNAHEPEELQKWFDLYKSTKEEYGIHDHDVANVDETGFRVGVGKQHKVLSKDKHRRIYISDPDDRDYLTVVECVSGNG